MSWIWITISAYFFGAVTVILDKYLLGSEKISSPSVYAFYVGILGMGVLLFWPLGFFYAAFALKIPSPHQFLLSMESGMFFLAAITALYFAIKKSEASKVTPVVFSIVPIVTLVLAYFVGLEQFSPGKIFGMVSLIVGGLLISFDLPLKLNKKKFFAGFHISIWAGAFFGCSTFLLKLVYMEQNFFNGYVWTRAGAFLATFCLLLIPAWKKEILQSISGGRRHKDSLHTGGLFIFNKVLGGTSSALINLAIGIGSVTLVSSLISVQYVFVLILAVLIGSKLPHIFEERLYFWDWAQKIVAIVIIAIGMFLISK